MGKKRLNVGIIGVGRFGKFSLSAYEKLKEIKVLAICSRSEDKLRKLARRYNIPYIFTDYKKLLQLKDIDIVVIATPPFLHAEIAREAINSKKHVLCEKPLALNLKEAEKIKKALRKEKVFFTIDYILRESKIIKKLKKIIDEKIFGNIQSITFINFASDTHLSPKHWFWDKEKSGGIWIEHGVHFFDLFNYLTSQKVKKIFSLSVKRNRKIEDQVSALAIYKNKTPASFFHSFTKPYAIESTLYTISFDKGKVVVKGWIPEEMEFEGLVNKSEERKLKEIIKEDYKKIKIGKVVRGRGREYLVDKKVKGKIKIKEKRDEAYKKMIEAVMLNLVRAIRKKEKLKFGFEEALESLKIAIAAEKNKLTY